MPRNQTARSMNSRLVQMAAAFVLIFALRYAKEVLVPIALAILFAFLLAPLVTRVERTKIGRVPSVLVVVVLAFLAIGSVGLIVAGQLSDLTNKLPQYTESLEHWIRRMRHDGSALSRLSQTADR